MVQVVRVVRIARRSKPCVMICEIQPGRGLRSG